MDDTIEESYELLFNTLKISVKVDFDLKRWYKYNVGNEYAKKKIFYGRRQYLWDFFSCRNDLLRSHHSLWIVLKILHVNYSEM